MSENQKPANLIDPHVVFSNGENVDLSDLSFFVDLKVIKRNKLQNGKSVDDSISINFLGNTGEDGNFTTKFTDNEENFGIKTIDYRINSSYVPQVDITFEDVRGQGLFNDFNNSKYKVLFDFPPPIFLLTMKGYYGQAVTNRLHLLKSNTSIDENGSYIIRCSFVGMTFAPLADILFDYLQVAPYLVGDGAAIDDITNTTLELKTTGKELISLIKTHTEDDRKFLEEKSNKQLLLSGYDRKDYINEFIEDIRSIGRQSDGQNNAIFAERNGDDVKVSIKWFVLEQSWLHRDSEKGKDIYSQLQIKLEEKKKFLEEVGINQSFPRIPDYEKLAITKDTTDNYHPLFKVNLSGINNKIKDALNSNADEINKKQKEVSQNVNEIVMQYIPGGPTLRNVLKILLNDAKTFFTELEAVAKKAEGSRPDNDSTGENQKYAFPKYFVNMNTKDSGGVPRKVQGLPPETWEEVNFVNRYINAKMKVGNYEKSQADATFDKQTAGDNKWLPISPFDSQLFTKHNIYSTVGKGNILDTIIKRGTVATKQTLLGYGSEFKGDKKLLQLYAKGEAYNIIQSLKGTKQDLLNYLITELSNVNFDFKTVNTPFNQRLKEGEKIYRIDKATPNVQYSGGDMVELKTADDFKEIGGVPVKRSNNNGGELIDKNLQEILEELDHEWYNPSHWFEKEIVFSQYNVPLVTDGAIANDNGVFKNESDFYDGKVFRFDTLRMPTAETFNNADLFLKALCEDLGSNIDDHVISPFDMQRFQKMAAIHEVPHFVLAWWGYVLTHIDSMNNSNYNPAQWKTIPETTQTILKKEYKSYKELFEANKNIVSTYFKNTNGLFSETPDDAFFGTDFVTKFTEIKYLILGYNWVFYPGVSKVIDYGEGEFASEYFKTLLNELKNNKENIRKEAEKVQNEVESVIRDKDLRTNLYYTFKSFVDKWMMGNGTLNLDKMFDVDSTFLMVDRAFNNIGDEVMLDLTPITDISTADTNLYTVILNLLSKNNFEFFALPTYVDYKDNGIFWNQSNVDKIFGTHDTLPRDINPKFICMYVGGTSAQLDMPEINQDSLSYGNDGGNIKDIEDLNGNSRVQAFRVSFGTQNQSFFNRVELDQAEFKETNESINILDNIAKNQGGNGEGLTQTKGNSLFNVYEQRSYSCTVHGLGNMMIQPTMYFDLDNIAMWKGAYLILEVNHRVEPNNITTSFKGVRVPKYTKPYVTEYSIVANLDLGSTYGYGTSNSDVTVNGRGVTSDDVKEIKGTLPYLGKNSSKNISNKERAFLDMLAYAEGTMGKGKYDGYDVMYSSKIIPAWKPDYKLGHGGEAWLNTGSGIDSTAAGRYQFLHGSWLDYSKGEGTVPGDPKNKPFNKVNQDVTALYVINDVRLKKYGLSVNGITHQNFIRVIDVLAPEWASLPYYKTNNLTPKNPVWSMGRGFYPGQGGKYTVDELWIVYSLALKKYENKNVNLEKELEELTYSNLSPAQESHISTLRPNVQEKFREFITRVQRETGWIVNIQDSYRSLEEQVIQKKRDSRNAEPGTSLHGYGLALDINLIKGGKTLVMDSPQAEWVASGAVGIAKSLGLVWGGEFSGYKDNVHFSVSGYSGADLLVKAKEKYGSNLKGFNGLEIDLS